MNATQTSRTGGSSPKLNLATEPWLPVRYVDGRAAQVSLGELFTDAEHIERLDPTHGVYHELAMLRLLVALVHRATQGPADAPTWQRLAQDWGTEVAAPVQAYLRTWQEAFWLVHPTHPFGQLPHGLRVQVNGGHAASLALFTPTDQSAWHLDRADERDRLTLTDAANRLLTVQVYAPSGFIGGVLAGHPGLSGGKTSGKSTSSGSARSTYVLGQTLAQTILLNTLPYTHDETDAPHWEQPWAAVTDLAGYAKEDGAGILPVGRVQWLTARLRAVTLTVGEDDLVHTVGVSAGDRYDVASPALKDIDPFWTWEVSTDKRGVQTATSRRPGGTPAAQLAWRGNALGAPATRERTTKKGVEVVQSQPAPVVTWVATLARERRRRGPVRLVTLGIVGERDTAAELVTLDTTTLDVAALDDGRTGRRLERFASKARDLAESSVKLVTDLARDIEPRSSAQRTAWTEEAWAAVQPVTDRHLHAVAGGAEHDPTLTALRTDLRRVTLTQVSHLLEGLAPARIGAACRPLGIFNARLRDLLTEPTGGDQ
nr:type I-E CRISPR-associated protein Cse1/CasA [Pseudactinotalea terrae]